MSQSTLSITTKKNGVPYDVTSVVLQSPSGVSPAYGLRRNDNNATVVAAGTAMVRVGVGQYQYPFTDPAQNLIYDYWRQLNVDGQTFYNNIITQSAQNSLPVSRYFDYQKFLRRWGTKNVANASNKDNTTNSPDLNAVQDSFIYADFEIDSTFAGSQYASPLDFSPWQGQIPPDISRTGMVIAYADLYDVRGWEDKNKVGNKISRLVQQAYDLLALYRVGVKQLNAKLAVDSSGNAVQRGLGIVRWTDVLSKYGTFWVPDGVLTWYTQMWSN